MPLIITDENASSICVPQDPRCGTIARDYSRVPYGSIPSVPPRAVNVIPMEEWPDRIADKIRTKSSLKNIWAQSGIGVLNQKNISYCHAFSVVLLMMLQRAKEGLPYRELSASSIGGPITNWRNAGAYIHDDLERAVEYGASTTGYVPMLTINQNDCKPGWKEDALQYRVTEFTDVRPRNFLEHGSLLLNNNPVGVGLNYWGHAVSDFDLLDLYPHKPATDWTRYGIEFLNSWGEEWGEGGFAVRTGGKALADAIYSLYQVIV